MTATLQIDALTTWSAPKRVETAQGPRNLRTGPAGEAFWAAWKSAKDQLKAAGVSCSKDPRSGAWQACWWLPVAGEERAKAEAAQAASRAIDAAVELPVPAGLSYLPYQKAGVAYAMNRPAVLLGDEPGLGKTIQAIGVWNCDPTIRKTLVVCPATLRLNWQREFGKWAVRPVKVVVVNGGKPTDFPTGDFDVLVINYDVVAKHRERLDAYRWDLLIVDEAHFCKSPKAQRTKAVFGARDKKGNVTAKPIVARRSLFLTGTPIVNRPIELWPLVERLDPTGLGRNFFAFAKRYANAHHNGYGWDFSGACRLDELQRLMRERFMVRRLKEEVLTDLPAKRRQVIELPANGASAAVAEERKVYESYQAAIEAMEAQLEEAADEEHFELATRVYDAERVEGIRRELARTKSVAFAEMSKARHAVALAKIPHVIEVLKEALENGPVVCFAHHKDVIAQLLAAFPGAVSITGETPMAERQAAVDAFQAGRAELFVGNILAAGVGITLVRSSHVVFAELDWVPGNMSQAEDRCHRIGQTDSVLVQHVVLEDSLDAVMVKKLIAKQEVIDAALDDRKDVNYGIEAGATVTLPAEVAQVSDARREATHRALRILAGMCDGAASLDGCGFNKFDTRTGKALAAQGCLTASQTLKAARLVNTYRRQLPAELVAAALGKI